MSVRSITVTLLLSCLFSLGCPPEARACLGPMLETFLFFLEVPPNLPEGTFVGSVEVLSSQKDTSEPFLTRLQARVTESNTHHHLVGKRIIIAYPETSCGPHLDTPDKWLKLDGTRPPLEKRHGLVIGPLDVADGKAVLSPFEAQLGTAKEQKMIVRQRK